MAQQTTISPLLFFCVLTSVTVLIAGVQSKAESDFSCSDNEFECDHNKCIPKTLKCDGNTDCLDETDEKNCHSG